MINQLEEYICQCQSFTLTLGILAPQSQTGFTIICRLHVQIYIEYK